MPTLLHRLLTAAVVLGVSTSLGACSEDPVRPAPLDTPSSTPTSTTTSTSSATPQAETAEQFIRRWVTAQNKMQVSGETQQYRNLGLDCNACEGFADRIDAIYSSGGVVRTKGWKILRIGQGPDPMSVELRVKITPTTFIEERGGVEQKLRGGERTEVIHLARPGGEWKTTSVAESDS